MKLGRRALLGAAGALVPSSVAAQSRPSWTGYPRLMQGPMLGVSGPTSATVWTRVSGPFAVCIEYGTDPTFASANSSERLTADLESDFVQTHRLSGLTPGAEYFYRVMVDGRPNPDTMGFEPLRLRAAPSGPSRFRVAFGSCARLARYPVQPIWRAVSEARPDLFLWVGDNVYADSLEPSILAEEYRRQRDIPEIRPVLTSTPQLAIWDDHDYGLNDHDARHPGKIRALETFARYWPNPPLGSAAAPGAYFRHNHGGVDFFFLDVRYHRDPNDMARGPGKTMLGSEQKAWLLNGLRESSAAFKVLVSGSAWNDGKPVGADSWSSYADERDEILATVMADGVTGVLLVSGDTHVGEANCLPWSGKGGYDLYEFVSSPLAQDVSDTYLNYRPVLRMRQVYARDVNVGIIDFDMSRADPTVSFELRDEGGQAAWPALTIRASELRPGVVSWTDKIDGVSQRRWQRAVEGGSYFGP